MLALFEIIPNHFNDVFKGVKLSEGLDPLAGDHCYTVETLKVF